MPGYRLHIAARRASIQIGTSSPVVSLTAYEQLRFSRGRSDTLELERSKPTVPLWKDILGAFGMLTLVLAATFLAWAVK